FAKAGYRVTGLDMDEDRVRQVNARRSYISDIPTAQLAAVVRAKRLSAHTDFELIRDMDVLIICVPTPLRRRYTPDISYILSAVRTIAKYVKKHALIILESTTYPGTTEELILPELQKGGRKVGRDFYLSFSPERIDPGNKLYDVTRIPKVVGGVEPKSGEYTALLYRKIIREIHVVSTAKSAEMTKLLENSFRIINIGWINEVAMMCHKMDIDVWEVIEAAKTKPFGFMAFYPGPGLGGHCIPIDPFYLTWKAREVGHATKFIELAGEINRGMPEYVVHRLMLALNKHGKAIGTSKVLVLGVAYKPDIDDLRESPSFELIEKFKDLGAEVDYNDPHIPETPKVRRHDLKLRSKDLSPEMLASYDAVVIATNHSDYDYALIGKHAKLIVDTRNAMKGFERRDHIVMA
ncbi:MAG: nucleotide sugar dehydrogenase, partial [Gammaproteobacteria bacterium]|nr:nucleotide sugar dehydrogenase [Gammaproteobacteria bacterium]